MDIPSQNGFDLNYIKALAASPAGQQLIQLLKQQDSPSLRNAAQKASQGNYSEAAQAAQMLLSDPNVRALLEKLGR